MTLSLIGRDASGALGSVVASSSPAVAARVVHLRDGVGAVNSQNVTDPRLGPRLLDELASGADASAALAAVVDDSAAMEYRQLLVLGAQGAPALHSGPHALGTFADARGADCVAGGNMLASATAPAAMVAAFEATPGELEGRLLAALKAGLEAGGEAGPLHSAGLSVVRGAGWRVTDLRVDWSDGDPVAELATLLELWLPQRDDYVTRGLNPTAAPSYGVPGDE